MGLRPGGVTAKTVQTVALPAETPLMQHDGSKAEATFTFSHSKFSSESKVVQVTLGYLDRRHTVHFRIQKEPVEKSFTVTSREAAAAF